MKKSVLFLFFILLTIDSKAENIVLFKSLESKDLALNKIVSELLAESKKELFDSYLKSLNPKETKGMAKKESFYKHPKIWLMDVGSSKKRQILINFDDYFGVGTHSSGVFVYEVGSENQFKNLYKRIASGIEWYEVKPETFANKAGFLLINGSSLSAKKNAVLFFWDGMKWSSAFSYVSSEYNQQTGGLKGTFLDSAGSKLYEAVAVDVGVDGPKCFDFFLSDLMLNQKLFLVSIKNRKKLNSNQVADFIAKMKDGKNRDFLGFRHFYSCN